VLAISALAAGWHALGRRVPGTPFFLGHVALAATLIGFAPWFGFFAFTGYFLVDRLPERWGLAGAIVTAGLVGTSQAGGWPGGDEVAPVWAWLLLVAVNVGVGAALMRFASREQRMQAELRAREREAGVLDERARLAREIHDTLAQGLTGIVTQLEAARAAAAPDRHIDAALALARESLTEARRSVDALRPEALERARLPEAIAAVARGWSGLHGIDATVSTEGDVRPMRPEIEVVLLRTAQEALANVGKHARATRVGLTLTYFDDVVMLDVRDDGVGFAPADDGAGGYGLTAMRERLDALAGRLEIESEPGRGTAISATMPAVVA